MVSHNPTTGLPLGEFRAASLAQVDEAIVAARRAFDRGAWPASSPAQRAKYLRKLMALMEGAQAVLTEIIVADVGTPVSMTVPLQIGGALSSITWFAEAAERGPDGWYERALVPQIGAAAPPSGSLLIREPVGVVAAIPTWNFPLTNIVWKMCGALAAGCTVILLPSPKAVHSTYAFWKLVEQLELPEGVVNLVYGDADVGEQLTSSPDIEMVSFTGSARVGGLIMEQASRTLKKLVLELGGKSPNIILPGTDIESVVKLSIDRLIGNSGQRCGATSRILVHDSQFDAFVAASKAYLETIVIGDPRDKATNIGPLIDHAHMRSVQGYLDRALGNGGKVLAGGNELPASLPGGAFMAPYLLGGLPNSAEFCQEEQFGPVGAVLPYASVDEAVEIANDSRYGLNAMVFGPTDQSIAVARRIRVGTVTVNGRAGARREAPWGGYRQSGLGKECGDDGFREFFEVKHVQWMMK